MGPISPGRWQVWQFRCNTGSTSLLKVGLNVGTAALAAATRMSPAIRQRTLEIISSSDSGESHRQPGKQQTNAVVANIPPLKRLPVPAIVEYVVLEQLKAAGNEKNRHRDQPLLRPRAAERQQQQSQHQKNNDMLRPMRD